MPFLIQVIGWILIIYGLLSLIQDIANEFTYKKIRHNMKIIVLTKDMEKNIDEFSRELFNLKRNNNYKEIIVIDLDNTNNIQSIKDKLEEQEINLNLLDKDSGMDYILNYFKGNDISFV